MSRSRVIQHDAHVFINCPFDSDYRPLFESIVFAVHDCGFIARCALEVADSAQVRIEKIAEIIGECRLGIHDISRTELDAVNQLPRFNMPLELGLFLGAKRFGPRAQGEKRCLILDRERYRFQKFISDIAGQDIEAHETRVELAIAIVRNWLRDALPSGVIIPGGEMIARRYRTFRGQLPELCDRLNQDHPDRLIFNDFTLLASVWLQENGW